MTDGNSPSFQSDPARDAAGSIAGYIYQIDLSILRWLQLGPNEYLELETGEDIDIVVPASLDPTAEQARVVTQVKRLSRNITLRSVSAISAVAHLAGHRVRNPNQRISMIFITTAGLAVERSGPFKKEAALARWNICVRKRQVDDDSLNGLRKLLRLAKRPKKGIQDNDWSALQSALDNDSDLISIVLGLEWVADAPSIEEVRESACALLGGFDGVSDEDAASRLHDGLFIMVLRAIVAGERRFDRARLDAALESSSVLAESHLAAAVRDELGKLEAEIAGTVARLDVIETLAKSVVRELGDLPPDSIQDLGLLDSSQIMVFLEGFIKTKVAATGVPDMSLPLPDERSIRRPLAEELVRDRLAHHGWLHIWGTIRTGKTTLVRQMVADASRVVWLRCRDLSGQQTLVQLRSTLRPMRAADDPTAIAELVGRDGILVLDDLPELESCPELEILILRAMLLMGGAGKIVTTGTRRLSNRVSADSRVGQVQGPPFIDADFRKLLAHRNAPEKLATNSTFLGHIITMTSGHVERLSHCIEVLERGKWSVDLPTLQALFAPASDAQESGRMLRLVESTTASSDERELLFRLCILEGELTRADARAVGRIETALIHPDVHLAALDGVWLAADTNKTWTVSPAIRPFGADQILPNTRAAVHLYAAERYFVERVGTPVQLGWAVHHLELAGEVDRAGMLTFQGLMSLVTDDRLDLDPGLAARWVAMPEGMTASVRLMVRAAQLRARRLSGRDLETGVRLLAIEMTSDPDPMHQRSLILAALLAHDAAAHFSPALATKWIVDSLQLSPSGTEFAEGLDETLHYAVLIHASHIHESCHIATWLDLLAALPKDLRQEWTGDPEFAMVARTTIANLWFTMKKAGADDASWDALLADLEAAAERSNDLGVDALVAACLRTKMIVLAEQYQDVDGAVAIASSKVEGLAAPHKALIVDEAGRQLAYSKRNAEAAPWLERGLGLYPAVPEYDIEAFNCLLISCQVAGELENTAAAVEFAKRAAELASVPESRIPPFAVVIAHAEHAVALWLAGRLHDSFQPLEQAVEDLFRVPERDDLWRTRFVLVGHTSGFLSKLASTGEPPAATKGGHPYLAPTPGMFRNNSTHLASRFVDAQAAFLPAQLLGFALAIGEYQRAVIWAERSVELAQVGAGMEPTFEAHLVLSAQSLIDGEFAASLDGVLRSARAMATSDVFGLPGPLPTDVRQALGGIPAAVRESILGGMAGSAAFGLVAAAYDLSGEERDVWATVSAEWLNEVHQLGAESNVRDAAAIIGAMQSGVGVNILKAIVAKESEVYAGTWGLAHLALATLSEAPSSVLGHHLQAARVIESRRQTLEPFLGMVVAPHFVRRWAAMIANARFRFRSPDRVLKELEEIRTGPDRDRIRHTLLVVADALRAPIDLRMRAWLATGKEP